MINDDDQNTPSISTHEGGRALREIQIFEALLESDHHDEVSRVVDMYFRRPSAEGE